jgi:hypothetical protein
VLAYRNDKGIDIKNFDDPKLKDLKIGVFQTSGVREALVKHGVTNLQLHVVTHDADLKPENQPWYQVQQVVDGDLDVAAVWGPFAGWVKSKGAPITIQPVNLWEDTVPSNSTSLRACARPMPSSNTCSNLPWRIRRTRSRNPQGLRRAACAMQPLSCAGRFARPW